MGACRNKILATSDNYFKYKRSRSDLYSDLLEAELFAQETLKHEPSKTEIAQARQQYLSSLAEQRRCGEDTGSAQKAITESPKKAESSASRSVACARC